MKQPTYFTILPVLAFLLFSLYWAASNDHSEKFVQCLQQKSDNSTAMSQIIYTPKDPLFTRILNMYIRNLKYGTPETPKPLAVLTPFQESQVQAAIYCSKKAGLQMRIRSGGNDLEGSSYVSYVPFFVLDTNGFRSISIDATTKTAMVGAGATFGELYYSINQTDSTLAFPGGFWATLGVSGHICGCGYGGLTRKFGVSSDNVLDACIINANGDILDRKSMGEDLFWAIRGGSCASFGVVIAFKLKLHRVPRVITAFNEIRTLEHDAATLIYKWQYIAPIMPKELNIMLQLTNSVPSYNSTQQTVFAIFTASFLGNVESLISIMDQHFPELGVTQSHCSTMHWVDYHMFLFGFPVEKATQILLSRTPAAPTPFLKMKSDFAQHPIPKKGVQKILDHLIGAPTKGVELEFIPLGGKMDEIHESSIPFPYRKGNSFILALTITWSKSDAIETCLAWIRKLHMIVGHYVPSNPRGAYVNYRDHDLGTNNLHGPTSVEQAKSTWGAPYYKGNFDRLVRVKTKVDPENYFNYEQSIPFYHLIHQCNER